MSASKRSLTLDLGSAPSSSKKARVAANAPILTTPDVQMLKMSSPELAKFLTSSGNLATPTPSGYIFPKTVTEEQAIYAKGFEDALKKMHSEEKSQDVAISTIEKATAAHRSTRSNSIIPPEQAPVSLSEHVAQQQPSRPSSEASGSISSSDSGNQLLPEGVRIKQESLDDDDDIRPVARKSSSRATVSPIDMEDQERIKLERKRQRNRVAASKCRKRKLEKISQLDDKVRLLKNENSELAAVVKKLKASVCDLKQQVMEHVNNGCQIMVTSEMGAF